MSSNSEAKVEMETCRVIINGLKNPRMKTKEAEGDLSHDGLIT